MSKLEKLRVVALEALKATGMPDDAGCGVVGAEYAADQVLRAVLLALREPSPEMCNAIDDVEFDNSHSSTLVRQWQAGIDAALGDGK